MRVIGAEEVDRALARPLALVEALEAAFRGEARVPVRHHHAVARPPGEGEATLLLMPAWTGGEAGTQPLIGTKIVTVFPGNAARGLPAVAGTYLLMDGDTGLALAAIDGARLTLHRTAAVSALAARFLARRDARRMTMVGAGALAPFLIRAHLAVRGIEEVLLWNHRSGRAEALAADLTAAGLPVAVAPDLEAAVRAADLVSCATLSTAPLVRGAWLAPGCHLDLVGAFTPAMREADDEALARAALVAIDTPAALTEGGDVAAALASGAMPAARIGPDLAALCRGQAPGRADDASVTVFKSVGTALADLAAAALVWASVEKTGI